MVTASAAKQTNDETRWDFSDARRGAPLSLNEFLDQQNPDLFFTGKEPWLIGIQKISWQTFFQVCTEEMDDLSLRAIKLVIEYCLEIVEEAESHIQGKPTLARLETALDRQYEEAYENTAYQYQWALRHPLVKAAIERALRNRFSAR